MFLLAMEGAIFYWLLTNFQQSANRGSFATRYAKTSLFLPKPSPIFYPASSLSMQQKKKFEMAGDLIDGVVGIEQTASHDAPVLTPMPPPPPPTPHQNSDSYSVFWAFKKPHLSPVFPHIARALKSLL